MCYSEDAATVELARSLPRAPHRAGGVEAASDSHPCLLLPERWLLCPQHISPAVKARKKSVLPETGKTDEEWEGWKSLAAHGTGGWQPSQCGVKVVKQCLM